MRFEVALRTLNPGLDILAPVRDNSWVREEQLRYLEEHNLPLPAQGSAYSINRGLWGITIGGQETLTSENTIPDDAWVLSTNAFSHPQKPSSHTLEFNRGVPVALDGEAMSPVALIEQLEVLAGGYGIGRGIHLGDTVLGTKGRVAFEAPAAITLITAHRELEKLVLSAQQMRMKDSIAAIYGDLVHEGKQLDLVCADIEAFLRSSQRRVTGTVRFSLRPGSLFIEGVVSKHSLLAATKGVYGESAGEWTASDTLGYARILSLPGSLQTRAAGRLIVKSAVVDKIASVAQHSELGHELRLSGDIPCEEGVLVAVRVLNNKTRYNQLELTSGRMATVNQGDVVVGALGHRKALRGYSGHLPTKLEAGDTIQLLNIGGVLGVCDSANPDVGPPFDCEVLGTVLHFPYLGERIWCAGEGGRQRTRWRRIAQYSRRARCCPGGNMHGLWQDGGSLRDRQPAAPPGTTRCGLQSHRCVTATRHPDNGGCRSVRDDDLFRSRHRDNDSRQWACADPSTVDCSCRAQTGRDRARTRRRLTRCLRRRGYLV